MTEKAIAIQSQTTDLNVGSISLPGTGAKSKLAGSFPLKFDVTKLRAGPITRRDAANIEVERLPYRVLATDILIEGCGWLEVVAQVRTKDLYRQRQDDVEGQQLFQTLNLSEPGTTEDGSAPNEPNWPVIDVYSPEGKFIGARQPMNGWMLCRPKKTAPAGARPRKSMKGAKKTAKKVARAAAAAAASNVTTASDL